MKELISRSLNWVCGGMYEEYLCSRVYRNSSTKGGVWSCIHCIIDTLFWVKESEHCRRCNLHYRRYIKGRF